MQQQTASSSGYFVPEQLLATSLIELTLNVRSLDELADMPLCPLALEPVALLPVAVLPVAELPVVPVEELPVIEPLLSAQ